MAEVRHTPQAEADLDALLYHLHRDNPAAAERLAHGFVDQSRMLARFPESRRLRPEIAAGVHSILVHPYVIFYRIERDIVQILRILHGPRDLRRIMRDESEE